MTLYQEYAELSAKVKELEQQKETLSALILSELKKQNAEAIENEVGRFSLAVRKSFVYTEVVKTKEAEVKELKKKEEEDGTAQPKETHYLRFSGAKEVKE